MSKKRSKIDPKWGPGLFEASASEFFVFFGCFLVFFGVFFLKFSRFLEPKRGPKWSEKSIKNLLKFDVFSEPLLEVILERFGC